MGAVASTTTSDRPTRKDSIIEGSTCSSDKICDSYTLPVQVSVFGSRPIQRYRLKETGIKIPFALIQTEYSNTTANSPCTAQADCAGSKVVIEKERCTETFVSNNYFNSNGLTPDTDSSVVTPQLNSSCGAFRDPITTIHDTNCGAFCCNPCSNITGQNEYRTKRIYAYGPMCTAFQIDTSIIVNDLFASVRLGGNVLPSSVIGLNMKPGAPDHHILRTRTGCNAHPAFVNENRTMRIEITDKSVTAAPDLAADGDYILLCDYNDNLTSVTAREIQSQGVYNPYLQKSYADLFKFQLESQAHSEIPYENEAEGATFLNAVGAGTVPTQASLGGSLSWFYITAGHFDYLRQRTQPNILNGWANGAGVLCHPNDTRLEENYNIPGLDVSSEASEFQTPCQMSGALNEYSALFNTTLYTNGTEAAYTAVETAFGDPPMGLHPNYLLERPNMWINLDEKGAAELIYDPIVGASSPVYFEIAIDVVDHVLPFDETHPVVDFIEGPTCAATRIFNASSLAEVTDIFVPLVTNVTVIVGFQLEMLKERVPQDATLAFGAQLDCSNTNIAIDNYRSLATSSGVGLDYVAPIDILFAEDVSDLEWFLFEFTTTDVTTTTFDDCLVTIYEYDSSQNNIVFNHIIEQHDFSCDILDVEGYENVEDFIRDLAKQHGVIDDDDDGDPSLDTTTWIVVGIISGFVFIGVVILGIWCIVENTKPDKK